MSDVFLSYAREDVAIAEKLAALLDANGISVWWDRRLVAGDDIDNVIEAALVASKAVVVLWSPHSVQSRWVRAEASAAADANKLVPIRIAPCTTPLSYRGIQTPDVFASRQQVEQLASLLSAKLRPAADQAGRIELSPQSTATFLGGMQSLIANPSADFAEQMTREMEFANRHPWAYWVGGIGVFLLSTLAVMNLLSMEFGSSFSVALLVWLVAYFAYRWYRLKRST